MLFLDSSLIARLRSSIDAILCLTLTGFLTCLSAQIPTGTVIVPRIGFFRGTQDLGRVRLDNGAPFDVGSIGPGLKVGAALQHAVGSSGWVLEGSVMRSLSGTGRASYRGIELIRLGGEFPVRTTTASVAAISPSLTTLPVFFKAGFGARHAIVRGEGDHEWLEGEASEWQLATLVGVGIRYRLFGALLEFELKDLATVPDFGGNRRVVNEIVFTVGLPIQIR
jgi:hypothetical protein